MSGSFVSRKCGGNFSSPFFHLCPKNGVRFPHKILISLMVACPGRANRPIFLWSYAPMRTNVNSKIALAITASRRPTHDVCLTPIRSVELAVFAFEGRLHFMIRPAGVPPCWRTFRTSVRSHSPTGGTFMLFRTGMRSLPWCRVLS